MAEQERREIDINTLSIDQVNTLILDQIDQQTQINQNIQYLRQIVAEKKRLLAEQSQNKNMKPITKDDLQVTGPEEEIPPIGEEPVV